MSTSPLHYSAQAVPDLREFAKAMTRMNFPMSSRIAEGLAGLLDQAQKFILPEGGRMFNGQTWRQAEVDALRLPYPAIAGEYQVDQESARPTGPMTVPTSRRIALAVDIEAAADMLPRMIGEGLDDPSGLVLVWPICRPDHDTRWVPYPTGAMVRRGDPVRAYDPDQDFVSPNARPTANSAVVPVRIVTMPELFQHAGGSYERAFYDTADELRAVAELCAVLNCSNIETRTISPRCRQGRGKNKRKLYEYRVLEVSVSSGGGHRDAGNSDRRSPRIHLRRGHVRQIGEDRTTWVQPCVVGDRRAGVVTKDYAVRS